MTYKQIINDYDAEIERLGNKLAHANSAIQASRISERMNSLAKQRDNAVRNFASISSKDASSNVWSIRGIPESQKNLVISQAQQQGITIAAWINDAINCKSSSKSTSADKKLSYQQIENLLGILQKIKEIGFEPPKEIMDKIFMYISQYL